MQPFNPVLSTLPRLLRIKLSHNGREDLLSRLIDLALAEARRPCVGGESIRLRLSELVFVDLRTKHAAIQRATATFARLIGRAAL